MYQEANVSSPQQFFRRTPLSTFAEYFSVYLQAMYQYF